MDVEVEKPHVHHRAGEHWLDKVLPISAIVISVISIWIAYHHGQVMQELVHQNERLVQANSLPHLQLFGSNTAQGGRQEVSFNVSNEGIGPAEIRSVQVLVDGKPVSRLGELLRTCCGQQDYSALATSTLLGTMIRPGGRVAYISFPANRASAPALAALDRARQENRIETRLCYCSVFDECWTRTSRDGDRPVRVEQCPMPQPQYRE